MPAGRAIDAVIFDLGGVVTGSPFEAIAAYEREAGLATGAIGRAVLAAGERGAWSRLERGELSVEAFVEPFEAECRALGLGLSGERLMAAIAAMGTPRPRMLAAIGRLRAHGLRVGALTNNWRSERAPAGPHALRPHFDAFVESRAVGLRKPDPRIYRLVLAQLAVGPERAAFLDDIGRNLKAARALGMATIKVDDADQALRELGTLVGLDLLV